MKSPYPSEVSSFIGASNCWHFDIPDIPHSIKPSNHTKIPVNPDSLALNSPFPHGFTSPAPQGQDTGRCSSAEGGLPRPAASAVQRALLEVPGVVEEPHLGHRGEMASTTRSEWLGLELSGNKMRKKLVQVDTKWSISAWLVGFVRKD